MKGITPFLWFDALAEEAMNFYTSIFPDSKIVTMSRYGDAGPGPKGQVAVGTFMLNGQEFMALNGGPQFKFTQAISLMVRCETQEEVDHYWEKLGEGGQYDQCGWLRDKFGLSWQIVPTILGELMSDPRKSNRVMQALMQMKKLDIEGLKKAGDES